MLCIDYIESSISANANLRFHAVSYAERYDGSKLDGSKMVRRCTLRVAWERCSNSVWIYVSFYFHLFDFCVINDIFIECKDTAFSFSSKFFEAFPPKFSKFNTVFPQKFSKTDFQNLQFDFQNLQKPLSEYVILAKSAKIVAESAKIECVAFMRLFACTNCLSLWLLFFRGN